MLGLFFLAVSFASESYHGLRLHTAPDGGASGCTCDFPQTPTGFFGDVLEVYFLRFGFGKVVQPSILPSSWKLLAQVQPSEKPMNTTVGLGVGAVAEGITANWTDLNGLELLTVLRSFPQVYVPIQERFFEANFASNGQVGLTKRPNPTAADGPLSIYQETAHLKVKLVPGTYVFSLPSGPVTLDSVLQINDCTVKMEMAVDGALLPCCEITDCSVTDANLSFDTFCTKDDGRNPIDTCKH